MGDRGPDPQDLARRVVAVDLAASSVIAPAISPSEIAEALLMLFAALLMLVSGFVFLAGGLFLTALGWRMRGRARGTIIGTQAGDDGETLPVVTFTTAQGTPVRFVAALGVGSTRSGRQVPVRYNERDPTDARIATFGRSYLDALFLVALGAMTLGLFVLAIFTL